MLKISGMVPDNVTLELRATPLSGKLLVILSPNPGVSYDDVDVDIVLEGSTTYHSPARTIVRRAKELDDLLSTDEVHTLKMLKANLTNENLSDEQFREFVGTFFRDTNERK